MGGYNGAMLERMQKDPQFAVTRGLEVLQTLTLASPGMDAEWVEAWAGFSQVPEDFESALRQGSASCGRFREWFLLERHSPALMGTPIDRLIDPWRASEEGFQEIVEPMLQASFTGILEVREVLAGQGAWLRDISGFGEYALADPNSSNHLEPGDLLVGRLYPLPGSVHLASGHAAWFRSPELRTALERDLGKARESRRSIIRIGAPQLEVMFFAPKIPAGQGAAERTAPPDLSEAVNEARTYLAQAGLESDVVQSIFLAMREAPMAPDQILTSPSDPVGRALELLAFETDLDLSQARALLTRAWQALSIQALLPKTARKAQAQESLDVREAVERFAQARAGGGDLDMLLANLERDLGLPGSSDLVADEEDLPAPDFPGVVGAMVEEFLWDAERMGTPVARYALEPFAQFAAKFGLFEELGQRDILSFATFWVLERGVLQDARQAEETLLALEAFCRWAEQEHSLNLHSALEAEWAGLRNNLPRVTEINSRWASPSAHALEDTADPGQLFALRDATIPEACQVIDRAGQVHTAKLPVELCQQLRPGDHLRARIDLHGVPEILCIYPPEASALYR